MRNSQERSTNAFKERICLSSEMLAATSLQITSHDFHEVIGVWL